MTYTPKPGDRVTSPLLVGEWEVRPRRDGDLTLCRLTQGAALVYVAPGDLTPVTPPLPPEPAVGSVVRAHGVLWNRGAETIGGNDWAGFTCDERWSYRPWSDLAADAEPVVPVSKVAEWVEGLANPCVNKFDVLNKFGWKP